MPIPTPDFIRNNTLNPHERRLLACARRGEDCFFYEDGAVEARVSDMQEAEAQKPLTERRDEMTLRALAIREQAEAPDAPTIRAALIRFLALGGNDEHPVDPYGVQLRGACISGTLNLEGCRGLRTLVLMGCVFDAAPILLDAAGETLNLPGSVLRRGLSADGLELSGALSLRHGFEARDALSLVGAKVGGHFSCIGGRFLGCDGDGNALVADGLEVKGGVFLSAGFEARGAVRLMVARIDGNLECIGGRFLGTDGDGNALVAEGAEVGGQVSFSEDFKARGAVRLLGARIGGQLNCTGGHFLRANRDGDALLADRVEAKGSVFLSAGFEAREGAVRLAGARIGGNLSCIRGRFLGCDRGGNALVADQLETGGNVFLGEGFEARGGVRLAGARIAGDLSCSGGRFVGEGTGTALLLQTAEITGNFLWRDLAAPPAAEVNLTAAHAGTLVDDLESWPKGKVLLDGFRYDRIVGPTDFETRRQWLERQVPAHLHEDFKPQPFEQLARCLREMGHMRDAIRVAVLKEKYRRRSEFRKSWNSVIWRKLWAIIKIPFLLIYDFIFDYGYLVNFRFKALCAIVILSAVGTFIFYGAYENGAMVPNNAVLLRDEWKNAVKESRGAPYAEFHERVPDYQRFNALIYSLDTFVPLVDLHQETAWIPQPEGKEGAWSWLHIYLWVHILAGWVITALFAASLTGLVKRDV